MGRFLAILLGVSLLAGCGAPTAEAPTRIRAAPSGALVFPDADPHDWQGRSPAAYAVHGIDVSRWQGEIDWRAVRRSGVAFAFLKATEGGDVVDPLFEANWEASRKAGIRRGAYHFYYFCRPAEEQARWFIRNVPRDARALPHVLDLEWNPYSPTCRRRPDGATVRAEADRFLDILERHYGRRPIVYTTPQFYRETGIGDLRRTEFWLRSTAGHPGEVYPGAGWTFWQYTGTGIVPGVSGPVDINAFRGSADAFRNWAG